MNGNVAFLGSGLMGTPMILRLLSAGFIVRIWNRSQQKARRAVDAGALMCATAADAVANASHICLCLTDANAMEDVLFGGGDLVSRLGGDATIIDFSTIGPNATKAFAERLARTAPGVRWIDAPVSGGVNGAESGELVIFCGGDERDVNEAKPILDPLAKRICHLGPVGSGQAAKLCNQLIVAVNVVAIAEALRLGRAQELDLGALTDALAGGWADSLPLQILGSRMARNVFEPPLVALGTFAKDLDLVSEGAETRLPMVHLASAIYRKVIEEFGDRDATALLTCLEKGR